MIAFYCDLCEKNYTLEEDIPGREDSKAPLGRPEGWIVTKKRDMCPECAKKV